MRDADVRTALLKSLAEHYAGDTETRIVQEMDVWSGTVRIDVAVINGELSGFELKSDTDTLERLPLQADIYSRVFDKITLVVGGKHAAKARSRVPQWWGMMIAQMDGDLVTLIPEREPEQNPSQEAYLVAELLSKHEAVAVLERFDLARGWRSKRVRMIHERLAAELSLPVLAEQVRAMLKGRPPEWLGQSRSDQLDVPVHAVFDPLL